MTYNLSNFEILNTLGHGAFGNVFKVKNKKIIKFMHLRKLF